LVEAITPVVVDGPAELAEAAAAWTADRVRAAASARRACYWALAGGETPRGCYERLARPDYRDGLPWGSVFVYWSDERQVPLGDPSSNYAMAKGALLDHVPIRLEQVFPLVGDPTPALRRIPASDQGWPRFDIIHLGLGEDGHTASLFPGSPALQEAQALVAHVHNAPKPPPERLTLTFPVINAARAVLVMVQGAAKKDALARVLRGDPALPASHVVPADGELRFLVDRAALGE
jgi:6-phosphogluconolactonase